ncbi:alpha-amidating enzyme precursor 2 [Biomphalaria glabrata]|nr:alpha-amidating enzyme precursor 2 [Biomphalaria glabrata]
MFYTNSSVANPSWQCGTNELPQLTGDNFAKDVSVPLPPNPALEEAAIGSHHHSGINHPDEANDFFLEQLESSFICITSDILNILSLSRELVPRQKTQDILMPGAKPNTINLKLWPMLPLHTTCCCMDVMVNLFLQTASDKNCPPMCKNGQPTIMFGWAKNAPPTVMPKGVGLRVGRKTSIKTIVLQVHYAKILKTQNLQITLDLNFTQPTKNSGDFTILLHTNLYPVDISCTFMMDKSIIPFAFRTHAHGLGTVITGYQYNGTYHEIGKGNPQWPQAFYPVKEVIEVKPGDALAVRCTYNSSSMDHPVGVGSTGNDEMCNYYIMLYAVLWLTHQENVLSMNLHS